MGQGTQPNHYVTNSSNNTKTIPNDAGKNMSAEDKAAFGKTLDKIVADSKAKAKADYSYADYNAPWLITKHYDDPAAMSAALRFVCAISNR